MTTPRQFGLALLVGTNEYLTFLSYLHQPMTAGVIWMAQCHSSKGSYFDGAYISTSRRLGYVALALVLDFPPSSLILPRWNFQRGDAFSLLLLPKLESNTFKQQ